MHPLTSLAKLAVETYIKKGEIISPPTNFPKEFLEKKSGVFVTINKNKDLRGCVGTYLPTRLNIAEETIHNAIAAATKDYRFGLIQEREFKFLTYTVYILSQPELIKNINFLNPKKFGIIVKTRPNISTDSFRKRNLFPKTGLLLPDLKGVDTIAKQISIACQKGGIDPTKEEILIYRFMVEKYE